MSNKRPHTVLDTNGYQLSAPLLPNGKWPPRLQIRAQAKAYKGYISDSYFELIARTGIENDKNNGNVIAEVEPQTLHAILNKLEDYARGTVTEERMAFSNYNFVFGRDKKRSDTQRLASRVVIGVKDGTINIAVIDSIDDSRPKISFPFGYDVRPRGRYSLLLSTGGKEDRAESSRTAAMAFVAAVRSSLESEMQLAQIRALEKLENSDGGGNNNNAGRYSESSSGASDPDADLPF
jgi:hypothetical protein